MDNSPPLHIELFESEPGWFTVIVGDRFSDKLGRDEALGVVATALFMGQTRLPYIKTYEQWHHWQRTFFCNDFQPPVALLSWNGRAQ